jgi:hypothetical protein
MGRRLVGIVGRAEFRCATLTGRGRRRPDGGCRLWAARPSGGGAAGRVVGDPQWVVPAAGVSDWSGVGGMGAEWRGGVSRWVATPMGSKTRLSGTGS